MGHLYLKIFIRHKVAKRSKAPAGAFPPVSNKAFLFNERIPIQRRGSKCSMLSE
jgi:hypothetical protein